MTWADETARLQWIPNSIRNSSWAIHKTVTVFVQRFHTKKHLLLQPTAPLQLKRFKFGSKMAIATSAPVLPNHKKQCCKISRFTGAPCIIFINSRSQLTFPHNFLFIQQIYVLNVLNMLHTLRFFFSKCRLFHNPTFFGSCVIHILYTGCAKI
jgi:hypothetical protein